MFLATDTHVKLLRPEKVSGGTDNATAGSGHRAACGGLAANTSNSTWTLTFSEL